jgi:hypothetical protein
VVQTALRVDAAFRNGYAETMGDAFCASPRGLFAGVLVAMLIAAFAFRVL